jgi:hypothetical protein
MIKTPITILDNFFDYPDKIRDYALNLKFEKDPDGKWPGLRTKPLHEINHLLFDAICKKVISIYFDLEQDSANITWKTYMSFQKVDKFYDSGWVHIDNPAIFTVIVYLNKNPNINSGTSIYKLKNDIIVSNMNELNVHKKNAYKGLIDIKDVDIKRKENNDQYVEVVKIHNEYNRIISFDSGLFHAAQDFFGDNDKEDRLTLIMFFNELCVNKSPVERMRSIKL